MSDPDQGEKKVGVPSWQLKKDENATNDTRKPTTDPENKEATLEQAKKFLEAEEVKDATTDKKIAFLESKGLKSEDIQELLGVSRNVDASSDAKVESKIKQSPTLQSSSTQSQIPPTPQQQPSQPAHTTNPSSIATSTTTAPPIITYPEFLTNPAHPKPLITKPRLLTTLYAFSALSLLLYGTNTYLVTPMLASLTTSRLDLASTASQNLQKLIAKLETMVSTVPSYTSNHISDSEREEEESDSEDPTELFHRDIGVQTSPILSPSASRPQSPSPGTDTVLNDQVTRLTKLTKSMNELISESTSEGEKTNELETTISALREYLDGMAYVVPNYGYGGTYGAYGGGKSEDDEIGKVKAGIRGVKGVLLSARSFPGGVRAGGR